MILNISQSNEEERDCDEKVSVRKILESVNIRSESNRNLSGGMKVPPDKKSAKLNKSKPRVRNPGFLLYNMNSLRIDLLTSAVGCAIMNSRISQH